MKKTYVSPCTEAAFVEATEMLAQSLPIIKDKTVSGGGAMTKKNDWDIFGEADDEAIE